MTAPTWSPFRSVIARIIGAPLDGDEAADGGGWAPRARNGTSRRWGRRGLALQAPRQTRRTFRGKVLTVQVVTASGSIEKRTIPVDKLMAGDDAVLDAVGRYDDRYLNAKAYQTQVA
jgi:hypothetical protein